VYLSQKLGARADQPENPQAVIADTNVSADRIRQAVERFDISDVLERNEGALIVGPPGSGKSSLLRHLLSNVADEWAGVQHHDFVPVLVHARSLLGLLPINRAIARAIREDLGARLDDIDLDTLFADRPLPGVSWLVLLDGLDEIFEASNRQQVIDIVKRWWSDPRYRFLLTSRPLRERELRALQVAAIPIFEIQAFAEDQLPFLARGWFRALDVPDPEEMTGHFVAQVHQARMAQLAQNPLIATIACVVFANDPGRGLPYSRAGLYEAFIGLFLDKIFTDRRFVDSIRERLGRYDPQAIAAVDVLVRDLRSLIQELAALRFTESVPSLQTAAAQLATKYRPQTVPLSSWNQLVADHAGLLSISVRFGHACGHCGSG
jgi:predicted NACHT family NTPase